ncbi:MAG: cofactor-independent phosphoglycerate mutase [Nitrososphaerota archaeon]|jgi:2,3-bisphosphoglycerate-independent phosphoglycerate mutase|nr:cofactor-independent phosphoglycerate mutase [Nitrososphaerota archaeon]
MKYILIIGDGMSDYPIAELGNKTPLQVAAKPNIDTIAARGKNGLIKNVPDGCTPGSDVAICAVLGYDPRIYCTGRGALEAPARNITLGTEDTAYRCNIITEENGTIADYSAGHITTKEATQLIEAVKEIYYKPGKIEFYPGLDYRHFLIMRNFTQPEQIYCSPPHDVIGQAIDDVMPKAKGPEVENNTQLLRDMIEGSRNILHNHPVNIARKKAGKRPGNLIWPWGGGKKPAMPTLKEKFGIKSAVISAVDLVRGLGIYAGMDIITVEGATGLYNTNYEGKADAAIKALETHDLVCVHVESPDEAGHVHDYKLKVRTIEDLDKRLVGRILNNIGEPYAIAVLPDHPTPVKIGTHTSDPVPFTIAAPNLKPDNVNAFDEFLAKQGGFGLVENDYLLTILLSLGKN